MAGNKVIESKRKELQVLSGNDSIVFAVTPDIFILINQQYYVFNKHDGGLIDIYKSCRHLVVSFYEKNNVCESYPTLFEVYNDKDKRGLMGSQGELIVPLDNRTYIRKNADGDMWACRNKGEGYDIVRCRITNNEIVILEDLMGYEKINENTHLAFMVVAGDPPKCVWKLAMWEKDIVLENVVVAEGLNHNFIAVKISDSYSKFMLSSVVEKQAKLWATMNINTYETTKRMYTDFVITHNGVVKAKTLNGRVVNII